VTTQGGARRHRVFYRLGWRESPRYAGSFKSKKEATRRKAWVLGELAAMKVPDLTVLKAPAKKPTLREAADTWRESRHDVTEGTRTLHRVALDRVLPALGAKPVDKITADDVTGVVKALAEAGKKRETIKKSVTYLAAVLDDAGVDPNPAKAKKVRLPHEDREEPNPPTAEHVEAVARLLAPAYPDGLPLARLVGRPARVGRAHEGRRLRRAGPARPTTRGVDEEPQGRLDRLARRARRGDRGEPASA
jgi:hypothetical protein